MFLNFENREILNMDNIEHIKAEQYSDNKVWIKITTKVGRYYQGFIIDKEEWLKLIEALQEDEKVFTLLKNPACEIFPPD